MGRETPKSLLNLPIVAGSNPGAAGIGLAADTWNDVDIATPAFNPANLPATVSLHDVYNNLTSVALTINSGVRGADGTLPATPVQNELFTPGFYALNATLSGLHPGTTYDLLLYGPYATASVLVDGNSFPSWTAIGGSWGPNWVLGDGCNEMAVVAPASGSIVINDPATAQEITALQIGAAPEPSPRALAVVGGLSRNHAVEMQRLLGLFA